MLSCQVVLYAANEGFSDARSASATLQQDLLNRRRLLSASQFERVPCAEEAIEQDSAILDSGARLSKETDTVARLMTRHVTEIE